VTAQVQLPSDYPAGKFIPYICR